MEDKKMRLRKLLFFLGSSLILLVLLSSCEELLGVTGNGDGNEQQATNQQAKQYTKLVIHPIGLFFEGFGDEEIINKQIGDGSAVIAGTYDQDSNIIDVDLTLTNYTDDETNVRVTTPSGNPISITGTYSKELGALSISGTAQLSNTDYNAVILEVSVNWNDETNTGPNLSGNVWVDDTHFDAATLGIDLGDGGGDGGDLTIDDIAGVWKIATISEYDEEDDKWYDDEFPMDLAYEFTYDRDNDLPGNSDIDGDGLADTYDMKQFIEITPDEEMTIYLAMYFENTNESVSVADLQADDWPVVASGLYTLDGVVEFISVDQDGYTINSSFGHIDGMEAELVDGGNTMILWGGDIEVTLTREPEDVLNDVVVLTEMDSPEYEIIEMFMSGGDGDGPVEFSMMLLSPMGELMDNFDNIGDNESFTYDNISGTKGTGGAFTAEISYSGYIVDDENNVSLDGTIDVTGVMSDVEFYADFYGTVTLTNGPVDSITIDYTITFLDEYEAELNGSVTIDGEVITLTDYFVEIEEDEGPAEISMKFLQPMEGLMMDFENLGENEDFSYENISGTTGTGGAYTATISYDNYNVDPDEGVYLDGDISVTGVMNDVETYADYYGTVTLTNAPIGSITIDYLATMLNETDVSLTGSVTIDGEVFTLDNYIVDVSDFGDYHGMPYPHDGTAEDLAAYYPLAAVADIGKVFESAADDMDPFENGSITEEDWEISGTYTSAQSFTYTITLTNFYPDPYSDVELSGISSGEATLDVNGDGTATLVSTGDIAIAGDDTGNSTVSFDLSLTIVGWQPDGTVTGTVTLDGTTYDASTELTFDFGMDEEM